MINRSEIIFFFLGGLIGTVAALLLAPRSGGKTRELFVGKFREVKDRSLKSIHEIQKSEKQAIEELQRCKEAQDKKADVRSLDLPKSKFNIEHKQKQNQIISRPWEYLEFYDALYKCDKFWSYI